MQPTFDFEDSQPEQAPAPAETLTRVVLDSGYAITYNRIIL